MRKISKNATSLELMCMAQYDMGRMDMLTSIQELLKKEIKSIEDDASVLTKELLKREKTLAGKVEK